MTVVHYLLSVSHPAAPSKEGSGPTPLVLKHLFVQSRVEISLRGAACSEPVCHLRPLSAETHITTHTHTHTPAPPTPPSADTHTHTHTHSSTHTHTHTHTHTDRHTLSHM